METGLKFRVSRLFRSSFESCRHENAFDTVHEPVFIANPELVPFLPLHKVPISPSIGCGCRPRRWFSSVGGPTRSEMDTSESEDTNTVASFRKMLMRRTSQTDGTRTDSLGSPIVDGMRKRGEGDDEEEFYGKTKTKTKKRNSGARRRKSNRERNLQLNTSSPAMGWFSSEQERKMVAAESEELFFSKSSGSSEYSSQTVQFPRRALRKRPTTEKRERRHRSLFIRRRHPLCSCSLFCGRNQGTIPAKGKVRESVAVVKTSRDPYGDFRESMVEMIVEKQIFNDYDLQQMLQCFLSLNSPHHHSIIIRAFTDIWDDLFSDD